MSELTKKELQDLTNLAVQRCRKALMGVGQLIEDDAQRAAMATVVAHDIIIGAAHMLVSASDDKLDINKAVILAMEGIAAEFKKLVAAAEVREVREGNE